MKRINGVRPLMSAHSKHAVDKRTWPGRGSTSEKVDQAFSDHAEGTIVANPTDKMGDCRYAVELFGHRTIQIASDGSLIAHVNIAV
jgi:hypothetical protein